MTRFLTMLTVVISLLAGCQNLRAQDPFSDPFNPSGAPEATLGGATTSTPADAAADAETDPVVLNLRADNPSSAEALTRAVGILIDLGRPDEALKYLSRLAGANLPAADLAALHQRFGSGLFFKLLRHPELQPVGAQFADAVLDAAHQTARSSQRLQSLITLLGDASPEVRYAALIDLRSAGDAAVTALIGVLADPGRKAEHKRIRTALVQLRQLSVRPLLALLEADDVELKLQAFVTLGQLEASEATPFLLRPYLLPSVDDRLQRAARYALLKTVGRTPTLDEAKLYLWRRAKQHLAGERGAGAETEEVWRWDAERRTVVAAVVPAQDAELDAAARLSADLLALAPSNLEYKRLYLVTMLEAGKRRAGPDVPLETGARDTYGRAVSAGPEALDDVLRFAMRQGHIGAAIGAAEVLGSIGDPRVLHQAGGAPRPLAQALRHANQRLRYTAAMAILKIDPHEPFPGSSYLPEALSYFLNTLGSPRTLIAHPRLDQSQTLAGRLAELGFQSDVSATGAQTLLQAARSSDYEFILISDVIDDPGVKELIQQLRQDPRTAALPIGLMARQENFRQFEDFAASDPMTDTIPRPGSLSAAALVARQLRQLGEEQRVGFEQRMVHARNALEQMARLAEQPQRYDFYDLFRQQETLQNVLFYSQLGPQAARVLGLLGTPTAQQALVTVASQNVRDLESRQSAAAAFAVAVQRRGLLLSRGEILLQYDRYNQSASQDRETQHVLGSLLDAIEAPARSKWKSLAGSDAGAAGVEQ